MAEEKSRTMSVMTGIPVPEDLRRTIYPWADIEGGPYLPDPEAKAIFVSASDEDDAKALRQSVYQSGVNYFNKREAPVGPVVRVVQDIPEKGNWGVMAWLQSKE